MARPAKTIAEKMIKVDHVGENGAVNIYRGQGLMASFRARKLLPELRHFQGHEETHRALFKRHLDAQGIRPCVSYHIGGAAGFFLGVITGLIGPKAIYATTYAIENVVLDHLEEQMRYLKNVDSAAYKCVAAIVRDERGHHDTAQSQIKNRTVMTGALITIVRLSTESVIRFGMR